MREGRVRQWLRALAQPTTYLGVAMLAFIFVALSYLLFQAWAADEEAAKRNGENLARMVAHSIGRLLTNADNTLLLLRQIHQSVPNQADLIALATDRGLKNSLTLQYSVVGADGIVKASSYSPDAIGLDISTFEHFRVHVDATEDKLFISAPHKLRVNRTWAVILTRRLSAPDGSFAGVVTASFNLSHLWTLYANLELGEHSGVSLIGFDGSVYSRTTKVGPQTDFTGQKFPNAGVLKRIQHKRADVYWNEPGGVDWVRRLVAYRVVEGYPLIATVGVSKAAVFKQWTEVARSYVAIAALLTCAILIAIVIGAVREKRLMTAKAELERVNLWFDTALDSMSQGLSMFDASERLLLVNNRYREMYGLRPDQMQPGDTVRTILAERPEFGLPSESIDAYLENTLREIKAGRPVDKLLETKEGRFYAISLRPVKNGGWVTTHQDVTEQTRAERAVLHLAHHDALTELTSRALFQTRVDRAVEQLRQHGRRFNILLLDLDRFKAVNDSLGHLAGDRLLRQVAGRLKACIQRDDVVARLGGDEFAILQPTGNSPRDDAVALAERLLCVVGEPYELDGHRVIVETSIGIVLAPEHGHEAEQLFKSADLALYQAKAEGRNTWRLFEPMMEKQARVRYELEIDLRKSIERGEFELHYQPQIDAHTRRTRGVEALVRWHHPTRGMVLPVEFIAIAEGTGLIVPLGEWILRRACADATTWPDDIKVAVNLSPIQFGKGNIVETVARVLSETGLAACRLELEITESVLLRHDEVNVSKLHQLKQLGVSIVLDDFGTGYSSLSYLRMFPFDKIKIDRSFVAEISTRSDCAAIVGAITGLARSLNMLATAEGVETIEQFELLRIAGCAQIQGYLFGRPGPLSELKFDREEPLGFDAKVA